MAASLNLVLHGHAHTNRVILFLSSKQIAKQALFIRNRTNSTSTRFGCLVVALWSKSMQEEGH